MNMAEELPIVAESPSRQYHPGIQGTLSSSMPYFLPGAAHMDIPIVCTDTVTTGQCRKGCPAHSL